MEEPRARWEREDEALEAEKRAELAEIMGMPGGIPAPPQAPR